MPGQYPGLIDHGTAPTLVGRATELGLLHAALASARKGAANVLVLTGEPGIGKTSLLRGFLDAARGDGAARDGAATDGAPTDGIRVLRLDGFAAEAELPYAGIDRLLPQLAAEVATIPNDLRSALAVATGRETGAVPDVFHVGLALLSLLGATATPAVVVVDDAHLLDAASLAVLAFVARRLRAEPVLMLFATREEPNALDTLAGLERHRLEGLDATSGIALLHSRGPQHLDPLLALKVVEQLGGHPLAIVDLGHRADAERLARRTLSIEPLPPGEILQAHYRREIERLSEPARGVALIAATDTTGSLDVVRTAARILDIDESAEAELERTGLIEVVGGIRFRHQLVRPAIYNAATALDRTQTHRALAAASARHGYDTAATMHAATVATMPDEAVAERLAALADAAGSRGALLTRAGLLMRAGELTAHGPARTDRALAAAEAAVGAGAAVLAGEVLDALDEGDLATAQRAAYFSARASLAMFVGDPVGIPRAPADLLRAADAYRPTSVDGEQDAVIAAFSAFLATETASVEVDEKELAAQASASARRGDGILAAVLDGIHAHLVLPYDRGVPVIRRAVEAARDIDGDLRMRLGQSLVPLAIGIGDPRAALDASRRSVAETTRRGALQQLDAALWTQSTLHVQLLDITAAGRALENVRELRRAIGYPAEHVVNAAHLALSGAPLAEVEAVAAAVRSVGFDGAWRIARAGIGARLLADGEYAQAYQCLRETLETPFSHIVRMTLPDVVEAAVRSGHADEARVAVDELGRLVATTPTPWVRGLAARSRALVEDGADAEPHYREAVRALDEADAAGQRARAQLLYGEWLRRERRRREAREQLAAAVRTFDARGAAPFAARARHEFAATGEQVPPPASAADLTPRESLVAQLAGEGRSNQEIAGALFISPHTVDYHLRKVFRKLGIASRRQLVDRHRE